MQYSHLKLDITVLLLLLIFFCEKQGIVDFNSEP